MGISTSNPDLFRAILAMDAYNRGYNAGIMSPGAGPNEGLTGTQIGVATVGIREDSQAAKDASFFAQSYTWAGKTVISYRGTDVFPTPFSGWTDIVAWTQFIGAYNTQQQYLAATFYKTVLNYGDSASITVTVH